MAYKILSLSKEPSHFGTLRAIRVMQTSEALGSLNVSRHRDTSGCMTNGLLQNRDTKRFAQGRVFSSQLHLSKIKWPSHVQRQTRLKGIRRTPRGSSKLLCYGHFFLTPDRSAKSFTDSSTAIASLSRRKPP